MKEFTPPIDCLFKNCSALLNTRGFEGTEGPL
jgi:hypothetical protein